MTLTPEQFNKLVTKEDLKALYNKLNFEKDLSKILNSINSITEKVDNIKHILVSDLAAHGRFEKRIERIEKVLKLQVTA